MHLSLHKSKEKSPFLFLAQLEINRKFLYFSFVLSVHQKTAICEALQHLQSQASGGEPPALPTHRDSPVTATSWCPVWLSPHARPCALCRGVWCVCTHEHVCGVSSPIMMLQGFQPASSLARPHRHSLSWQLCLVNCVFSLAP